MSLNTSIECVLFDLDGTLVDTADEFVVVVQALAFADGGLTAMHDATSSLETHRRPGDPR